MKIQDALTVNSTVAATSYTGTWAGDQIGAVYGGVPTGALVPFAGTSAPSGYLDCDGSAVSRSTYSALFSAIGTTWGAGNGTTTFNVPNLSRRVLMGSGGTGTATIANSVGSTGGAETHTLVTAEMPQHQHNGAGTRFATTGAGTAFNLTIGGGGYNYINNVTPEGGDGAHNNIQPSAIVKFVIKT